MAAIDFEPVVKTVAPTLATALLGPLGGIAARVAAQAIFKDDTVSQNAATPQSIIDAITTSRDPGLIDRLKQADLDLKKYEAQNKLQFAQLDAASTENARQMRIAGFASNNHTADQLAWLVIVSFLVVAGLVLLGCGIFISGFVDLAHSDPQTLVGVSGLIGAILGYFSSNAQQVVGFYFGSSAGSKAKSEQLGIATQSAISASARLGQTAVTTDSGGRTTVASDNAKIELKDKAGGSDRDVVALNERPEPVQALIAPSLRPQAPPQNWPELLSYLVKPHLHYTGSVSWHLVADGISIAGASALGTPGKPDTVRRAWEWFHEEILSASAEFAVPIELIVAVLCNESVGGARTREEAAAAERQERGFVSYAQTPERVSIGAMQTLISTARACLPEGRALTADDLRGTLTSIRAGTAYLAQQKDISLFDPPLAGAAYNAGSIRPDPAPGNRWKLYCYPEGTGQYIDRLVPYFNDAMRTCRSDGWTNAAAEVPSFVSAFLRTT